MRLERIQRPTILLATSVAILIPIFFIGCDKAPSSISNRSKNKTMATSQNIDNFSVFLDIVSNINDFEPTSARRKALVNLNRWAETVEETDEWEPDEMVSRVPEHFRNHESLSTLDRMEFEPADVRYIQECLWFRDVARWVAQPKQNIGVGHLIEQAQAAGDADVAKQIERAADPLAAALQTLDEKLSREDSDQLAIAIRLFDWTIRNTQLDKMLPKRKELIGPNPLANNDDEEKPVAEITQAGPGYQHFPWQTLVYGHGDAWQRARVFMMLARQANIDAVMLGFSDTGRSTLSTPWLAAVHISDRLFLFDTELGIPLPGKALPIATLAEVQADPSMLDVLSIQDGDAELKYPVIKIKGNQFDITPDHLVALIDAAPQSLSLRMERVEERLSGENKMVLGIKPSGLSTELKQKHGLNSVGLWTVSFETVIFRELLAQVIERDPKIRAMFFQAEDIFEGIHPLANGRRKHFEGVLESDEQENLSGAKTLYLEARKPNEQINGLADSEELQRQYGVMRMPGESPTAWALRIKYMQTFFGITRIHAGYWLAVAHFDAGGYTDAINWFNYTAERKNSEVWKSSINYNLARAHEQIGDWETAVKMLESDDSETRHGSLLRARMLKTRNGGLTPDPAPEPKQADADE